VRSSSVFVPSSLPRCAKARLPPLNGRDQRLRVRQARARRADRPGKVTVTGARGQAQPTPAGV
jgi:hypothetical protein